MNKANIEESVEWIYPFILGSATTLPESRARYFKLFNTVYLAGWISNAKLQVPFLYLPAGFRPRERIDLAVSQSSAGAHATARLTVMPDGAVQYNLASDNSQFIAVGASLQACFIADSAIL